MATSLALLASLLWGTTDFLGGTVSRRLAATTVVAVSQAVALAGLLAVAAVMGEFGAATDYLWWAVAAAVVNLVALTAFYAGLAAGTMGVVAPIAALGVAVPVVVGIAQGDRPEPWQVAGLLLAVAGVVLASGPELHGAGPGGRRAARRPLLLAAVAGIGFGTTIVCLTHGAQSSTVMTLVVMRAVSVAILVGLAAAGTVRLTVQRRDLAVLTVIGVGDAGANAALAVASTHGLLALVAVLSSLYPAVTVLLARAVHDERLRRVQAVGVVGALTGVVLIAAGG